MEGHGDGTTISVQSPTAGHTGTVESPSVLPLSFACLLISEKSVSVDGSVLTPAWRAGNMGKDLKRSRLLYFPRQMEIVVGRGVHRSFKDQHYFTER